MFLSGKHELFRGKHCEFGSCLFPQSHICQIFVRITYLGNLVPTSMALGWFFFFFSHPLYLSYLFSKSGFCVLLPILPSPIDISMLSFGQIGVSKWLHLSVYIYFLFLFFRVYIYPCKQFRLWLETTFCEIWSGYTRVVQVPHWGKFINLTFRSMQMKTFKCNHLIWTKIIMNIVCVCSAINIIIYYELSNKPHSEKNAMRDQSRLRSICASAEPNQSPMTGFLPTRPKI